MDPQAAANLAALARAHERMLKASANHGVPSRSNGWQEQKVRLFVLAVIVAIVALLAFEPWKAQRAASLEVPRGDVIAASC